MQSELVFQPPHCPNKSCLMPYLKARRFCEGSPPYIVKGREFRLDGSIRQRFLCKYCHRSFSDATFDLNFRFQKRARINHRIFFGVLHNRSNRSLARELKVSECLVRTRVLRLSQMALLRHHEFISQIKINEDIAYDGLEAFAHSQYEPNNINQAIGANSLFCYLFNFSPMNRKGRTSPRQRKYLANLEDAYGRFDPSAIRKASLSLFKELIARKDPRCRKLVLRTDEHFQYRRAIERDLKPEERLQLEHLSVSSKATRNYKNILFPVNHLDLLIRRKVAAFSRETICFSKKASRMFHKYVLYICYKNYMKPQFVKKHESNKKAHTDSPAMHLGLTTKLLKFSEFFGQRIVAPKLNKLPLDWSIHFNDMSPFNRSRAFA